MAATGFRPIVSPRGLVLGVLLLNCGWALALPPLLTRPPGPWATAGVVGGTVGFVVILALFLRTAVDRDGVDRRRRTMTALLIGAAGLLWVPLYGWAAPHQEPWAWLAGFVVGSVAFLGIRIGLLTGIGLSGAAVAGAVLFGGDPVGNLLVLAGCALAVWLMGQVPVMLLRLLWTAEAARDTEAALAVAQERLRAERELHDVLGHRLTVIALKAELAGGLLRTDPARAASIHEEIRSLATDTLAQARRAVHGDTVGDLAGQLDSAALVLGSAGITTTVDSDGVGALPTELNRLFARVVREAVTNVLRHSDATTVSIVVTADRPRLVVRNDGVRPVPDPRPSTGTGLAALAARCSAAGVPLRSGPITGDRFELLVGAGPDDMVAR